MLFVFIYIYNTSVQYQMMIVSFNSDTTGKIYWSRNCLPSGAPEFTIHF